MSQSESHPFTQIFSQERETAGAPIRLNHHQQTPPPSPARNIAKLELNFEVSTAVTPPKGVTHFRLVHALGVTSDIEYEPAVGGFLPVAHEVDGISAISHSDYLSVNQEEPATITFETNLPSQHIDDKATVVEVVGIEFFQGFGNRYLPMAQGKAAMVVGAF